MANNLKKESKNGEEERFGSFIDNTEEEEDFDLNLLDD